MEVVGDEKYRCFITTPTNDTLTHPTVMVSMHGYSIKVSEERVRDIQPHPGGRKSSLPGARTF